jgi:hypothetical protein
MSDNLFLFIVFCRCFHVGASARGMLRQFLYMVNRERKTSAYVVAHSAN